MKCTKEQHLTYTENAKSLFAQMSLGEKIYLMSGKVSFDTEELKAMLKDPTKHYNHIPYPNGDCKRLGIHAMRFCDGLVGWFAVLAKAPVFRSPCSGEPALILKNSKRC